MPLKLSTDPEVEPMMLAAGEGMATVGAAARLAGAASTTGRTPRSKLKSLIVKVIEGQLERMNAFDFKRMYSGIEIELQW
jgi:hypothetical protein